MTDNLVPDEAWNALASDVASLENVVAVEGDALEITRLIERSVRAAAPYIAAAALESVNQDLLREPDIEFNHEWLPGAHVVIGYLEQRAKMLREEANND